MSTSVGLHEDPSKLSQEVTDRHRALASLGEELEAVDWYDQRVQVTKDAELKAILGHNRDEEKEHAAMVTEWLRRNDAKWNEHLREYLFSTGSIVGREKAATGSGGDSAAGGTASSDGSLGIGSLKKDKA
ncbi:MAG TPA: ferritin-like domain-containing protein [Candidatus Binatia bacterium]|jgi:ferritin-like protein|nr:ferritin-like domain-containing protein [Candidatus Binatia bacterium]